MSSVVLIDNGGANLASVQHAFARLGASIRVSRDPAVIGSAERVVLPGVGAAGDGMRRLREAGLDKVVPKLQQPVLGICLGMQLLYEQSEERDTPCLGVIPGTATRFTPAADRPVPHLGWNRLQRYREGELLDGVEDAWAWFAHSYALPVGPETLATAGYGDEFSAVVAHENFYGAQFHPERSGHAGTALLKNFLALGH